MEYMPIVVQAIADDEYNVYAYFDDGTITSINMKDKLDKGVFTQLRNIDTFKKTLTVMNETVAWDISGNHDPCDCIDLDPIVIYNSKQVKESEFFHKI